MTIDGVSSSNINDNIIRNTNENIVVTSSGAINNTLRDNKTNNDLNIVTFTDDASESYNFVGSNVGKCYYSSNTESVTVASTVTDLVTIAPSTEPNVGDIFKVTASFRITKGSTEGDTNVLIRSVGGTGTFDTVIQGRETIYDHMVGENFDGTITAIYECTSAGSLIARLSASSEDSDSTVASGDAKIFVEKMR